MKKILQVFFVSLFVVSASLSFGLDSSLILAGDQANYSGVDLVVGGTQKVDQGGSCEYKIVWVEKCRNRTVDGKIYTVCEYVKKKVCVR
jgi:hypothetical protein